MALIEIVDLPSYKKVISAILNNQRVFIVSSKFVTWLVSY